MDNDERDQRLERDQRPDSEASGPNDDGDSAAPIPEDAPLDGAEEEDEFETASWPQQDAEPHVIAEPPVEAPGQDADPAGQVPEEVASPEATAEEDVEHRTGPAAWEPTDEAGPEPTVDQTAQQRSEPPPSDVEAYPPPIEAEPHAPDAGPVAAHSVPATEPGESTRCARCGTENRPGISFCRNCGQRLVVAGAPTTMERPAAPEGTQACPRCGTHNRAGVAFCQNCGANLRAAGEGYVPPAVAATAAGMAAREDAGGRALLGPVVLMIGAIGIVTAWLLPFFLGNGSLWEQSFGRSDGYGVAFWSAYSGLQTLERQMYFGFAAPAPLLAGVLVLLAVGGFLRPAPAVLQLIGLLGTLAWAIGLVVLFVLVEIVGGPGGDLLDVLRALSPGGIIFMLASLIVVIGALTRVGRG